MDEHDNIRSLDVWLEQADLAGSTMTSFLAQMFCGEDLLPNKYTLSTQDLVNAKKMLGAMYFVGLIENGQDVLFMFNRLGINDYLPDKHVLNKKSTYVRPHDMKLAHKIILSRYPEEQEIYDEAIRLNREFKSRTKDCDKAVAYTRLRRDLSKYMKSIFDR